MRGKKMGLKCPCDFGYDFAFVLFPSKKMKGMKSNASESFDDGYHVTCLQPLFGEGLKLFDPQKADYFLEFEIIGCCL
jgi:hypothetical protein